ncbi:hypothetical protein K438DRAFT_1607258, partial [Mycena galopus ATCC 62051]
MSVAKKHKVGLYTKFNVQECKDVLLGHDCCDCPRFLSIMDSCIPKLTRAQENARVYDRKRHENSLPDTVFPPNPPTKDHLHRILTGSGSAFLPDRFVEAGCAVCGRLTLKTQLTALTEFKGDLTVLSLPGVTHKERFSPTDAIEDRGGPILAEGCDAICVSCET